MSRYMRMRAILSTNHSEGRLLSILQDWNYDKYLYDIFFNNQFDIRKSARRSFCGSLEEVKRWIEQ